jgi:exosortase/archaeosortase family protein
MNKQTFRWIILFCVLMGAFYWLDQSEWFKQVVISRLSELNTDATTWVLSFLGLHARVVGGEVITASVRFKIAESCTGSFVFMMYTAAILPFPTPWKWRLLGLLFGAITLFFINLVRTSLIILVASRFPQSLWTFHIIIGQIIVIVGMLSVFLWWAKNSQQNHQLSLFKSNWTVLRTLTLFCIGYLCGYWLYQVFLDSSFGLLVKGIIESHSIWIMSALNDTFSQNHLALFSFQQIRLIEGCLSSPMVVVFVAIVFAWPANWWKRGVIILVGFVPFFYGYHLIRVLLISVTMGFQPKEVNFVYNFYGQISLTIALFALVAYSWCSKQKKISYGKFLRLLVASALIGVVVALGVGWLARNIIIPFLSTRISGPPLLSYDPEQAISTMTDFQVFIWLSLVGTRPGLGWSKKLLVGLLGVLAALAGLTGIVVLFETFRLAPHKGLLKVAVILLPFAVYYLWAFLQEGRQSSAKSRPQLKNLRTGVCELQYSLCLTGSMIV